MKTTDIEKGLFGVEMDSALLSDDGTVELVLIQTPPPEEKEIQENSGRQKNVDILQSLIGGDSPILEDDLTDGTPTILVFPELAFPSSSFEELDKIISGAPRSLIVIAGFGSAKKASFLEDFPSERDGAEIAWPNEGGPALEQTLNGGWCWVHTPGSVPNCIAFFKTFSEQTIEPVLFENSWLSSCNLRILFEDAVLFPLICADILCERNDNAIKRISDYVEGKCGPDRKALVIGSLYQPETGHETWRRSMVKTVSSARLVTVNHAVNKPHHSDLKADWRNQTGVFWQEIHGINVNNRFVREVRHTPLVGGVVRDVAACVSFGTLSWDSGEATEGRWLYRARGHYRIGGDGPERCTGELSVKCDIEFDFVIRRHCGNGTHPNRFIVGRDELLANITSVDPFNANRFLDLLLNGTKANDNRPGPRVVEENSDEISRGVDALSFLRSLTNTDWCDLENDGQLRLTAEDEEGLILVWNDPTLGRAKILQELQIWLEKEAPHPPLLVVANSRSGEFGTTGILSRNPRTDTTTAPGENEHEDRVLKSMRQRRAFLIRIGELENLYEHDEDETVRNDLNTLISGAFASMS